VYERVKASPATEVRTGNWHTVTGL